MSSGNFKHDLFDQFARVGKALSNANRLEMLEFLAQCERSVEQLANVCGLSVANTSQHLQQLRHAGLVSSRKHGLHVIYSLNNARHVVSLLTALRDIAENNLAEVNQLIETFLTVKDSLEPVPRVELLSRANLGHVTILDVRPAEEYAEGHVPGAINIPLHELDRHLDDLDPEQEIVAYCRGPHCVLAFDAVARLRQQGFQARRLEDGFPEWKQAGLPTQ